MYSKGFSLIELMVSMAIGLFLMAGVFTVYLNTRDSQRMLEDQVAMLDNARFAMETIGYDLRHAGLWGRLNEPGNVDAALAAGLVANECAPGWSTTATVPVMGFDGSSPYVGTCTPNYWAGNPAAPATDVIEMRYTHGAALAALQPNMLYMNGDVNQSVYFVGAASPSVSASAQDFQAVANAYYISNFTDDVADGIPALHRVSVEPGPVVVDQVLLSGVVNLQVQFGIDTDNDGAVNTYVDPGPAVEWNKVRSAQVWIVVQSTDNQPDLDTTVTFSIAGNPAVTYPNDGFRKVMLTSVVQMRQF